jgi:hypothetical protein
MLAFIGNLPAKLGRRVPVHAGTAGYLWPGMEHPTGNGTDHLIAIQMRVSESAGDE